MKKLFCVGALALSLTTAAVAAPADTQTSIKHLPNGETSITIHGNARPHRVARPAAAGPAYYEIDVTAPPRLRAAAGYPAAVAAAPAYAPRPVAPPPVAPYNRPDSGLTPLYDTGSDDYGYFGGYPYGDYGYGYGYPYYGYGYGFYGRGHYRGGGYGYHGGGGFRGGGGGLHGGGGSHGGGGHGGGHR